MRGELFRVSSTLYSLLHRLELSKIEYPASNRCKTRREKAKTTITTTTGVYDSHHPASPSHSS